MDNAKKAALAAIDEKNELIAEVADSIWDYAELSMQEVKSAALFVKVLKEEGFQVEEGICGIPTAFSASYGSGKPVIGFLAEYDALSGLSQEAGSTEYHELVKGGNGHGCGHNLLGAGAMAAAIGLKHYLAGTGKSGTVILYGCPGEEGVASKAYMARDGLWYNLDAALTWHAGDCNEVATGSTNSCIQMLYTFHGLASQASTAPERGRSALDAVELMNVGVQFLREHMSDKARVHYAITDAGGRSPNVVQPRASVLYMVRSNHVAEAVELQARVDKIAQGAALMTDTTIERRFVDGLSDTVCNHALEKVLYDNFAELGVPACTPEEHAFMEKLSATYAGSDIPSGVGAENDPAFAEKVQALRAGHFNDFLVPLYQGPAFNAGSTDVGDVSYQCPTAQIHMAVWPNHVPCHSWQVVSCNKTPLAHRATVHAGKVLCAAAIDLIQQPELLEQALKRRRKRCMIGTGAMCDPYMPAERSLGLTRKCLEIIEHYGFGVSILTKSDLILRDLDLLKRINKKTRCVVQMTLTTCDEDQCRIIEPHVCTTSRRAQVLEIMRDEGIPAIIWMCPILPFINDTEENIQGIIEYGERARVHGILAFDIGVTLRDGDRQYFYSRLDEHYPGLKKQYMDMYGNAYEVGSPRKKELMAFFKRLCRERQMETDINKLFAYLQKFEDKGAGEQLSFMDLI